MKGMADGIRRNGAGPRSTSGQMEIWQKMCRAGAEMIRAGGGQPHCEGNAKSPQSPAQTLRLKRRNS